MAVRLPTKRFRGCFAAGGAGSGDSGGDSGELSGSWMSGEAMVNAEGGREGNRLDSCLNPTMADPGGEGQLGNTVPSKAVRVR